MTRSTASADAGAAVVARGVAASYGGHLALRDVDLVIPRGGLTALVGPNGSGKSTLLALIAGLVEPVRGTMQVLGDAPGAARLAARVAVVLQSTRTNETLPITVREVVVMARYAHRGLRGRLTHADRRAVDTALGAVGAADLADRHLRDLSGGERQRVLVAQGLAQEAPLLLLDEPVTALDLSSRVDILAAVGAARDRGVTVVMATHDLDDAETADQVVVLAGRVVAAGPPDDVLTGAVLREAYGGRHGEDEPTARAVLAARHDEHVHGEEPDGAPYPGGRHRRSERWWT